jgi:inhibitor of KinA sporulation pathway (predicted exonuclease)
MAVKVNEDKVLKLIDGTEISVRPLKISLLRSFMKKFAEIADVANDNDKSMDVLMECVQIAMQQYKPELAEDLAKLEESLDLPTVYKIVEEASGINLGESSLLGTMPAN